MSFNSISESSKVDNCAAVECEKTPVFCLQVPSVRSNLDHGVPPPSPILP